MDAVVCTRAVFQVKRRFGRPELRHSAARVATRRVWCLQSWIACSGNREWRLVGPGIERVPSTRGVRKVQAGMPGLQWAVPRSLCAFAFLLHGHRLQQLDRRC